MAQRTIVLTGASDGIGAAAARDLAAKGHRMLLVGRSPGKTAAVAREIGADHFVADFERLDDVRALAEDLRTATDRIDVLANNAGGILGRRTLTVDGHEKTLQVNHLAPFLLTNLLLDELRAGEGIVVNTSSSAARVLARFDIEDLEAEHSYSPHTAYGNAKLANILFTRGLHRRYAGSGIRAVAFDPGNVRTNFASQTTSVMRIVYRTPLAHLFLISPEKGGANLVFFADGTPGVTWQTDTFYTEIVPAGAHRTNPLIDDDVLVEALWDRSAEMVGIPTGE